MGVYTGVLLIDPLPAWASEAIVTAHAKPASAPLVDNPLVPQGKQTNQINAATPPRKPAPGKPEPNNAARASRTPVAVKGLFF
jgi:hypothetical protein